MFDEAKLVTGFATELLDESVGASPRKWAVILAALLFGAGLTLWLLKRRGALGGGGGEVATPVAPVAPPAPAGTTSVAS